MANNNNKKQKSSFNFTWIYMIILAVLGNSNWVAMDYAEVIVHIFLPEERAFYDIEHLWADAELTEIPDLD